MQHEVTQRQQLLDRAGHILQEGWARHPIWEYDRRAIASGPLRIKEWDYYYIISHEHQVCLTVTVSDLGYLGLTAVCLVDLKAGTAVQQDAMRILPLGRTGLSKSSADASSASLIRDWRSTYRHRGTGGSSPSGQRDSACPPERPDLRPM